MKYRRVQSLKGRILLGILISAFFLVATVAVFYYGFYESMSEQLDSTYEAYTWELGEQLFSNMEDIEDAVRSLSYNQNVQSFLFSVDPIECILARSDTDGLIQIICKNNVLQNIYIKSHYGRARHYNYESRSPLVEALERLIDTVDISSFEPVYMTVGEEFKEMFPSSFIYIAPIYNTLPRTEITARANSGVCAVLCDMSKIISLTEKSKLYSSGVTAMVYNGEIVSSSRPVTEKEAYELCMQRNEYKISKINGSKYLVNSIELGSDGWQFSYMVPESFVLRHSYKARAIGFTITALSSFLIISFLQVMLASVGKATNHIITEMNNLDASDPSQRIRVRGPSEFQTISREINNMLERMQNHYSAEKELKDKVYNALLAQSIAEMAAYRNQINPHFLFNTLECIRSMASVYSAEPIEETVCALSELFRYSLYSGTIVLLKEELAHAQNYISVMQQRYPDSVYLRVRTTEKAENEATLSMVLQPLVENAIKHGIKKKKTLIIQIQGDVNEKGILEVTIADNGPGIPKAKLQDIQELLNNWRTIGNTDPQNHVGLENIYRRLKLLAGDECEFEIKSVEGYYTVVKYKLPSNIVKNNIYKFTLKPPYATE